MRKWITLVEQASEFQQIPQQMANLGLGVDMWEDDERIDLHWIERLPGTPPGKGAEAMEILCHYADRTGKIILLQVENEALGAYYAQFGFDDADHWDDHWPDWDIDDCMIRQPQ